MIFVEMGAALRGEDSQALCRRAGEGAGVCLSRPRQAHTDTNAVCMEKPGSSSWRVAERLFSPRLGRDFGHICANELSPATVITAARVPGMLAPPGWPLRARGSGALLHRQAPGGPLAAGRRGGAASPWELRMLPGAAERWLQPLRGAEPSRLPRVTSLIPTRLPARSRRPGAGLLPGHCPGSPLPPSLTRAGTGTRGKPLRAGSLRAGGAHAGAELGEKGPSRAPCLPPAPALPPPLVTGTDELIMMWLLLMHLCGAGCASGGWGSTGRAGPSAPLRSAAAALPMAPEEVKGAGTAARAPAAREGAGQAGSGGAAPTCRQGGQQGSGGRGRCAGCVRFASPRFPQTLPVVWKSLSRRKRAGARLTLSPLTLSKSLWLRQ